MSKEMSKQEKEAWDNAWKNATIAQEELSNIVDVDEFFESTPLDVKILLLNPPQQRTGENGEYYTFVGQIDDGSKRIIGFNNGSTVVKSQIEELAGKYPVIVEFQKIKSQSGKGREYYTLKVKQQEKKGD